MRVVYSTRPYRGHLHPFVPLGQELRRAGHHVAVASAPRLLAAVSETGFTWLPAGMHPIAAAKQFPDEDADYGYRTIRAKVDELLEILLTWYRPDVMVREPTDLAAALAAEISAVPSVTLGIGHFIPAASWQYLAGDTLRALRNSYQLPDDPGLAFLYRGLYLDAVPPEWQDIEGRRPRHYRSVGYRPWDGTAQLPAGWEALDPALPSVLVTLGTVYHDDPELLETMVEALDDGTMSVFCTTGSEPLDPVRFPARVRAASYAPHSAILPRCQVLVCHGGFNTVMGALSLGVPVVCVPLGSDQFFNASRCEALGVGLHLDRDGLTPEAVRDAVRRVLAEPGFADRARVVQAEIAGLPDPAACRELLESLSQPARCGTTRSRSGKRTR